MSKSSSHNNDIVQPVYISSEKELTLEFQSFYKYLSDTEADWSKRSESLRRLKATILGGAPEFDCFYPLLTKLVQGLNMQLNDLRSSISKEAGAIICLISEVCQEKLEAISDKLMNKDALIKLISNANKILSEVGHQCVCSLIENVKSPKFIPKIFEEISSKSSTLRSKLSFYLDLILKNYPSNILEKNISILEPMIEKLVCDANKETRTYARQAFLEYQAMFPNKAQKLYMKFDNPTQKALNDDKNSPALRKNNEVLKEPIKEKPKINLLSTQSHKKEEEPYDQSNDNLSKTVGFAPKLQSKTPEKLSESKKTNTNRTANSSSGVNGDDDTSLYNREIELEDTDDYYNTKTMKSDKTLEKKSHGLPIPLSKKVTGQVNSSTNAKSNKTYKELNEKKSKDEEFTEELTEQKKGISSHEIKKKILTNLNDKQKNDSIHNNNNINNDYNSNNNEQEYYDQKQITKEKYGSNNIITTYNTDQNNKHNEEENYEEKQYYQQQKYGKPESKTLYQNNEMILEKTDKILKNNIKKEESKTNSDDKEDILLIKEEEFDLILEKTENTNWSIRATAFEKFHDLLTENTKHQALSFNKVLLQKMFNSHISHLLDPHFKVVQSCLNSLTKIVTVYWDSMSLLNLETLVSNLLVNLADSKDKTYSKANVLLNLLEKLFAGDDLVGALYKSLESTTKIKVKICALEALILVIKNCETYFNSYTNLKAFVVKIASLITENLQFKQILMPCFGVMLALKEKNLQTLMSCVISLPPNLISNIRLMACQIAPELEDNLKEYILKTMKEVKKETVSRLNKQPSKEDNKSQPSQKELLLPKAQTNENLMEIEDEKTFPIKLNTNSYISNNNLNNNNSSINSSNNNNISYNPKESIDNTKEKKKNSLSEFDDIKKIENLLKDIKGNNDIISTEINNILVTLAKYLESNINKYQEASLKLMKKLFLYFENYQKIVPDTIAKLLNLYHLSYQETHQLDELLEILIPKTNKITFMKALVDKTAVEKAPYLQIMIKWVSFIAKGAQINEIKPFLDHLIDIFKIAINDGSPDVRKSVVFCMVDLYFLLKHEIEPYFQMFHPNQQKLIMIYIKRKAEK